MFNPKIVYFDASLVKDFSYLGVSKRLGRPRVKKIEAVAPSRLEFFCCLISKSNFSSLLEVLR